jgi:hypothetical protein
VGLFKKSFISRKSLKAVCIWMTVNEALVFCLKNKYPITKQGLIYIGKKEGWIYYYKNHLRVTYKDLIEHIKISRNKAPFGWVLISSMSKLAKNESEYYRILNKSDIEIRIYGREKKRYGRKEAIKKIFRQHRKSNTKSKKERGKSK